MFQGLPVLGAQCEPMAIRGHRFVACVTHDLTSESVWVGEVFALHAPQNLIAGVLDVIHSGGAEPGQPVLTLASLTGVGAGPCVGSICVDLLAPIATVQIATADAAGKASFTVTPPVSAVGIRLHLQAFTIDRSGFVAKSNVTTSLVR